MVTAAVSGSSVMLTADLEAGAIAYVDADWLPADGRSSVPAIVVEPDRTIRWGGDTRRLPQHVEPDAAAGAILGRMAREAVAAATDRPAGPVEVVGAGAVAAAVRDLLDLPDSGTAGSPSAIVDTTGDPAVISAATERLADGGMLVLAGESRGRPIALNLYPDVHGRGLRVIGVAPPLSDPGDPEETGPRGTIAPPGTAGRQSWYKVVSVSA